MVLIPCFGVQTKKTNFFAVIVVKTEIDSFSFLYILISLKKKIVGRHQSRTQGLQKFKTVEFYGQLIVIN
jgi:hypothetical protein